jgi:hypothetical protein
MKELTPYIIDLFNKNQVHFLDISTDYILSEEFILKNKNKLDWFIICQKQKLSESFIIENQSNVNFIV